VRRLRLIEILGAIITCLSNFLLDGVYTCSTSKAPKANRFKSSEIEEKIEVNIKCNIDLDFLFDFREF
jgi:hypothetical protein